MRCLLYISLTDQLYASASRYVHYQMQKKTERKTTYNFLCVISPSILLFLQIRSVRNGADCVEMTHKSIPSIDTIPSIPRLDTKSIWRRRRTRILRSDWTFGFFGLSRQELSRRIVPDHLVLLTLVKSSVIGESENRSETLITLDSCGHTSRQAEQLLLPLLACVSRGLHAGQDLCPIPS